MKADLENPMQGMPKMTDMQSMYQMMQSMYQMTQIMYQMMSMQNMYQMMSMNVMPQMNGMYKMSQMMGMQDMNYMHEMPPMTSMDMQKNTMQFPIPMLVNLEQLSPTQIKISYDRDVDVRLGMKSTNYWIKDTMNVVPKGIATLGKNDSVNAGNSLTDSMVRIDSNKGSSKSFILTFNQTIPRGAAYMLIICYVTVKGAPPYSGDNGMITFIGK